MLPLQPLNPLILPIIQILLPPHMSAMHSPPLPLLRNPLHSRFYRPIAKNPTHLSSQPVILLIHIDLPPILANPQLLLLGQLPDFPIVSLVPDCGGGGEEEGAGDHGEDEGEAEE